MGVNLKSFFLIEAGVAHAPIATGGGKKKSPFKAKAKDDDEKKPEDDEDEEVGEDELGPDLDYDDPTPEWDEDAETDKEWARLYGGGKEEEEEEKPVPFSSKSQPPSKALQGGKAGLTLSGDKQTLVTLQQALEGVRAKNEDIADWVEECVSAISAAVRKGQTDVTLPKFEATPSLDSFNDDPGADEEEY